jgi:hypothetical protein
VSKASQPIGGTFDLSWNGKTLSNLRANMSADDLANYLQLWDDFGQAIVTRTKDCAGYKWSVKWLTGGRKPALTVRNN